ncbi:bacterial mobilization protein MobC [Porphyromonas gingivalis W4087]|uniref:Bacterial mobilization protein MobC n=2 Tax=Porphyromonas gingivalis TaxID=837 RepID=A0A0E2LPX7_PORGN|nr:bacterial mobilization protein MobC [Porphyromonas gingivalis F0570]ERJ91242.1 bacterial mobilization protein MobC [Porphyromonas gingivalis W4087]
MFWVTQNLPNAHLSARNNPDGLINKTKETMTIQDKNRGGRPTKKLSEKRRYAVLLKLNTMEYFTLKSKASEAGVNKNEYLRSLISEGQIKARITVEQMKEIRLLSGMANNINQIAHRLNTFGVSTVPTELRMLKLLVDEQLKNLKR